MTQLRKQRGRVVGLSPTAAARRRVKELRQARGWSARELAERCQAQGLDIDRDVLASFESGRRASLSVDELTVLALVLDVSPADLLAVPDATMAVGSWFVSPVEAAQWWRGERPLPSQDADVWQASRSAVATAAGRLASPAELARALRAAGLVVRLVDEGAGDGER